MKTRNTALLPKVVNISLIIGILLIAINIVLTVNGSSPFNYL